MEDKILIVDNTIEEITIEEFTGAPTGTIITTTHGMDKGDQHTIRDIVGLTTKLHDIEKLHQVRSNLGGHADYYLWGEEATEDNPLGPGYFVRLGEDGMIRKCTNETIELRPTDLTLDTDENGNVIIYALAGNITTADINKYYVVGTEVPYDIYAYDGVEYVKKSAYNYDGEKVVKTCHTTDILGVTVSSAGFVGNDEDIVDTYTSAKATDINYTLVATTGIVDVLCSHDVIVGDYVFPTVSGQAAKSTGSYGYLVTALVQNGVVVQTVNKDELLYARIVLSQSMVNAKKISDNVDYLLAETTRIGENVVKAVSNAQTALDEVRDSGNSLSDRVNNFESSMNAMGEQLYTNTIAVDNANTTAANAEAIARQAETYVQEVTSNATGSASEALAIAKTLEKEMEALSADMNTYSSKVDTIEDEQSTQAVMISKANDNIAVVQTKATNLENSVTSLANKDTELASTMSLINQKANEQGASITALTSKIDKYSVGEYSQAYGLTQAQAADILEAGKIVFIPTDFVSSDASFTEIYNPIVVETWVTTDKNTKYIYSDGTYYYYHNGSQWTSISIGDGQTAGYCTTRFIEGYSYVWGGQKWMPETQSQNVFFTDTVPTTISTVSPLYWVVGAGYEGTDYKVGALYLCKNSAWSEVALGTSNSMSRTVALVTQTQNSWQVAINNVNNDMATLSAKVDENGSNVAMVASVVKEVEGVNLDFADNTEKVPYASKDDIISTDKTKYFVVGEKTPYDIYYYDGTQYVRKINWSYDGQRVLQPNTASIVTSANEDTSGIKLSASHIKFEGETYTVNAGNIDFTGDDYKINADRIELAGSTTFSNYAKLDDVITNTEYRYALSTSNITLEDNPEWNTTYPVRASNEYIWRETKITKGNNDIITTVECITPADGQDGTSVNIKGTADEQPTNIGGGLYTIKFNGTIITDGELGDGYMYGEPADLFVCVKVNSGDGEADHFQNVGQIQGPQGIAGASLQAKYLNSSTTPTITDNDVSGWDDAITPPDEGESTYMTQRVGTAGTWSTPIQISGIDGKPGADGESVKFIYYQSEVEKTNWTGIFDSNGMFVSGELAKDNWSESPQGVNNTKKYEYVSTSTTYDIVKLEVDGEEVKKKNWKGFTSPVIWSKYGEKGLDGDGVEYWYYLSSSSTAPTISDFNATTGEFTKTTEDGSWTDNPSGTTLDDRYEYVVQIKKTTTADGTTYAKSDVTLWAVYDGLLARYVVGVAQPTTPTGEQGLTEAYAATETSEAISWSATPPTTIEVGKTLWVSYKTVLGTTWGMPIKTSAVDGLNGAGIQQVITHYLVTNIVSPEVTTGGTTAPTVEVNEFTDAAGNTFTPSWNTKIQHWGVKVDANHTITTKAEDVAHIYQYLWVCEKMIMDDANNTVRWGDPRLDASMTTIGNWCAENDKTVINGGNIATGSITAAQMAADSIKSQNYNGTIDDNGTITAYGTVGTMLNLKDGVLDSNNIRITGHVTATSGNIGGCEIVGGQLTASQLSSLSANLGEVTAGSIESSNYKDRTPIVWGETQEELIPSEGLSYTLSDDGTYYSVSRGDCTDTDIVIPSTYNELPVTTISGYWGGLFNAIKSIKLPDSITTINESAFSNCSQLETINIPIGVTRLEAAIFQGCGKLESMIIPSEVSFIGQNAFNGCGALKKIIIPDCVASIGIGAFYGCSSLTSVVIGNSVTSIGRRAFYGCTALQSIIIPKSVTSISENAFQQCSNLTIYCEAETQPGRWNTNWNYSSCPVYWYSETEPESEGNYWHYKDAEGFKISCDDKYMINSPYFKATQDGEIEASAGKIGGWELQKYETEEGDILTALSNKYLTLRTRNDNSSTQNYASSIELKGYYNTLITLPSEDGGGDDSKKSFHMAKNYTGSLDIISFLTWLCSRVMTGDFEWNTSIISVLKTPVFYNGAIYKYGMAEKFEIGEEYYLYLLPQFGFNDMVVCGPYQPNAQIATSINQPKQTSTIIRDCDISTIDIVARTADIDTLSVDAIAGSTSGGGLVFNSNPIVKNATPVHVKLTIQSNESSWWPVLNFYADSQYTTPYTLTQSHSITIDGSYMTSKYGYDEYTKAVDVPSGVSSYSCWPDVSVSTLLGNTVSDVDFNIAYRGKTTVLYEGASEFTRFIGVETNFLPVEDERYILGGENNKWNDVYSKNAACNTSDRNEKNSIEQLPAQYDAFFDALQPVRYKFNQNESNRYHVGFIAQDVQEALSAANIPTSDFAGYIAYDKTDGTTGYGLRYGEFIALNTYEIQKLKKEVSELKNELAKLKSQQNDYSDE